MTPDEVPLDKHVRPHLVTPLWEWCRSQDLVRRVGGSGPQVLTARAKRMCIPLEIPTPPSPVDLESIVRREPDLLLDMANWLLGERYSLEQQENELQDIQKRLDSLGRSSRPRARKPSGFRDSARNLEAILFQGRSAVAVGDPPNHLTERLPRELVEEYNRSVSRDDAISGYLRNAWNSAWRHDNPSEVEAYNDAVKALEASLAPIVTPENPKPTLGTIISALRAKPEKWETRFRGPETVQALTAMLDELWKTNSRHAGMPPNDLDEAQDAVTIAVGIVALVRRGFIFPAAKT